MPLSNRITELSKRNQFVSLVEPLEETIDMVHSGKSLQIRFGINNGIVEHFKVFGVLSTMNKAVVEAIGSLYLNKAFWKLGQIDERELRNFLQDQNDKAPFPKELDTEFSELLALFPVAVKKTILNLVCPTVVENNEDKSRAHGLIETLEGLKDHFNKVLLPHLGKTTGFKSLYHWDPPVLTILKNSQDLGENRFLNELLEEVYLVSLGITHLKLVAVEEKSI